MPRGATPVPADGPTLERMRHGPVSRLEASIADAAGGIGCPWRGLDTLTVMLQRGSITEPMRRAGEQFHDLFQEAGLDGLFSADPTRIPVQLNTGRVWQKSGGNEAARLSVLSALDALGGVNGPGGACAWHVLGCEMSIIRWALTYGWQNRRIHKQAAAGILIADLYILQAHYAF